MCYRILCDDDSMRCTMIYNGHAVDTIFCLPICMQQTGTARFWWFGVMQPNPAARGKTTGRPYNKVALLHLVFPRATPCHFEKQVYEEVNASVRSETNASIRPEINTNVRLIRYHGLYFNVTHTTTFHKRAIVYCQLAIKFAKVYNHTRNWLIGIFTLLMAIIVTSKANTFFNLSLCF